MVHLCHADLLADHLLLPHIAISILVAAHVLCHHIQTVVTGAVNTVADGAQFVGKVSRQPACNTHAASATWSPCCTALGLRGLRVV